MATADSFGLFWNSDNGDRKYNADSMERWLRKFFTSGVFEGDLQVLESSGMTVAIQPGYCNLFGKVGLFEVVNSITLDAANSRYPRIDTIVVERNDTDRIIYLKKVNGSYAGDNPQPTAPIWDETIGIYQLVLAQIYVGAGVSSISQQDITDKRADSSVCGYITGTVTEMDFSQFAEQFEGYYANFVQDSNTEYNAWKTDRNQAFSLWEGNFETNADAWLTAFQGALSAWFSQMQGQISTDAAVSLQNQINELKYIYVQDGILYMPNTKASVNNGILIVSTT